MRRDNRGLSLVELMVVIAIIAVVTSVGVMGVNAMTGRPAQQCAQKVVYSLERHRTTAMGKVDASYTLRWDASQNQVMLDEYVKNEGAGTTSTTPLGAGGVKLFYITSADATEHSLEAEGSLTLSFDRSSGAFKPLASGAFCTEIIAKRGGREFSVKLVPLTGKVYID